MGKNMKYFQSQKNLKKVLIQVQLKSFPPKTPP
jgi:hypothetical protein